MNTNCQLLLESIQEAIFMLDKDGYITYSNNSAGLITGFSSTELLNKSISFLYADADEGFRADFDLSQAMKKNKWKTQGWRKKKDGTRFWGEATVTPIQDRGQITGFSVLLRDVSDQKQHQMFLQETADLYRFMVEGVRDYAIFLLDAEGYIRTWNEGARRIKGWSAEEIIGKHFSSFYTKEDLDDKKPERELRIAIATGKYEEEWWRVKKDGSLFWANVVITALFNEQNKLIGFSKVTRDLTERRENEERLRQSEQRYRLLVEQVPDYGIFLLDEKGRVISWNEGAHRINGYTTEEILGKYFSIFYPEEDIISGKPTNELKIARSEGKFEEEGWRLRKDGSRFWAHVLITPVYNSEKILIGYSKVTRDLTEKKEAEKALRESRENYRQLAGELKVTVSELSYANQELEQFTSIVSHDLQEPVRSIKSFLQLIQMKIQQTDSPELNLYVSKAINAANRMRELIQSLLNYSQLSRDEISRVSLNVDEIFNEVMQNLRTAIEMNEAVVNIDSQVDVVYGDRVQLVQVIQNLVSNAIKFSDKEQPVINISVREEKGQVKFAITDNGIGIEQKDIKKVFEIFKRLHTEKPYPGTGIGLAICKKIIDRHQGKIWPESEPGKGTTFYFTLKNETKPRTRKNEKV